MPSKKEKKEKIGIKNLIQKGLFVGLTENETGIMKCPICGEMMNWSTNGKYEYVCGNKKCKYKAKESIRYNRKLFSLAPDHCFRSDDDYDDYGSESDNDNDDSIDDDDEYYDDSIDDDEYGW